MYIYIYIYIYDLYKDAVPFWAVTQILAERSYEAINDNNNNSNNTINYYY